MVKRQILRILIIISIVSMTLLPLSGCGAPQVTFTAQSQPANGGSITPGTGAYDNDVVVNITAAPAAGYRFDHWEGAVSGSKPALSLTMNGSKNVIAVFKKINKLAVSVTPDGSGSVNPVNGTYDEGQKVEIAAVPAQNYQFSGWSGDASGSSDRLTITMSSDKNVIASFTKKAFSLQTNVATKGFGDVDPVSGSYEPGTTVQVKAYPYGGYKFSRWEGSVSSTNSTLDLLMDSDKTLTAYFIQSFRIKSSVSPADTGTIKIDPAAGPYDEGSTVRITAVANFPYKFTNWTGISDSTTNPVNVKMDSDKTITANFAALSPSVPYSKDGQIMYVTSPSPVIPLKAGEWVEFRIGLTPSAAVVVLDPDSKVVLDLGANITVANNRFQATKTGDYTVKIISDLAFIINYVLQYTYYFQPQ